MLGDDTPHDIRTSALPYPTDRKAALDVAPMLLGLTWSVVNQKYSLNLLHHLFRYLHELMQARHIPLVILQIRLLERDQISDRITTYQPGSSRLQRIHRG